MTDFIVTKDMNGVSTHKHADFLKLHLVQN